MGGQFSVDCGLHADFRSALGSIPFSRGGEENFCSGGDLDDFTSEVDCISLSPVLRKCSSLSTHASW